MKPVTIRLLTNENDQRKRLEKLHTSGIFGHQFQKSTIVPTIDVLSTLSTLKISRTQSRFSGRKFVSESENKLNF